jgi:hypothetical protein
MADAEQVRLIVKSVRPSSDAKPPFQARSRWDYRTSLRTDAVKVAQWRAFLRRARLSSDPPPFEELAACLREFLLPVLTAVAKVNEFARGWSAGGPWQ